MPYLRVFWLYLRLGVINELQYRVNFLIHALQSILSLGTALGGLAVIYSHTATLAGWRPDEMLALLGVYFLIGGIVNWVIRPSMEQLMTDVRDGMLDYVLTKPEDAQVLVSVRRVEFWRLLNIGLGLALLAIAPTRLSAGFGAWQGLAFTLTLVSGGVIVYCFLLILATCSFWFVRVENILVIFQAMYEAGKWPVGIYPPWLRATLTFVVPVGFAITVPTEALTGRLTWQSLLGALVLAGVLLAASRWFWGVGIRHYSGASA